MMKLIGASLLAILAIATVSMSAMAQESSTYTKETIEDRGEVQVIRTEITTDVAETESCTVTTIRTVDKASNKEIKTDTSEVCLDHD